MARMMLDSKKLWIGEIPSHWKLKRIKSIIQPSKDGIKIGPFGSALTNKTIGEGEYNVYSQANLISSDFSTTKNTIDSNTFEELKSYEVFPDDICLSMMGTIGKCKKVPVGIRRGIMDSHLIKIRLSESVESRFFEYVYDKDRGGVCFAQMQYDKKGFIMDGLNTSIVKNLFFPLPPIEEQNKISDFLDMECSRIDSVIAQTRASIEEYKKLKQAVITQAVTRGIRPNRQMKDSGIEWIGNIPDDWDCMLLKRHCAFQTGSTPSTANEQWFNGELNWFTPADFNDKFYLIDSSRKLSLLAQKDGVATMIPQNTVMIIGIGGTAGKIGYTTKECSCNQQITAIKADDKVFPKYLMYWMIANTIRLKDTALYTTLPIINNQTIGQYPLLLPKTLKEQVEIAGYLDSKVIDIEVLIEKKEKIILNVEKYKRALIFEYVTGKKEVPNADYSS